MTEPFLDAMCDLIQEDVGSRGLRTDPKDNLITACPGDFAAACRSIAATKDPSIGIVTGFFIPHAMPPAGETDGPLGALFLARALTPLGAKIVFLTDPFCTSALETGLAACGLSEQVELIVLPPWKTGSATGPSFAEVFNACATLTHLVALERAGPSHTYQSIEAQPRTAEATLELFRAEVPRQDHDRCHTMKGRDITSFMSPAHVLFEKTSSYRPGFTTIGIGDGGNEIGMGKIPWDVIRRNIPGGGLVACRVPTDHLIVCGVSNWGAYGLAAGVRLLSGHLADPALFDVERERTILQAMVERGPLVDGVTGKPSVTVDGLSFEHYAAVLRRLGEIA